MTDVDPDIMDRLNAERDAVSKRMVSISLGVKTAKINEERQKKLWQQGLSSKRAFELAQL